MTAFLDPVLCKSTSWIRRVMLAALVGWSGSLLVWPAVTQAGPGAHGPNGEHLDAPPANAPRSSTGPRMESHTESFELVATLGGGELSVLIDRFATNEPVLEAQVQVESQGITAKGIFQKDHGDYAFTDEKLLAALARPGQHSLVFTVTKGEEADLLEGVLVVGDAVQMGERHAHDEAHDHAEDHAHEHHDRGWMAGGVIGLLLAGVGGWWWRSARRAKGEEV